jgi:hypothetical protein
MSSNSTNGSNDNPQGNPQGNPLGGGGKGPGIKETIKKILSTDPTGPIHKRHNAVVDPEKDMDSFFKFLEKNDPQTLEKIKNNMKKNS